MVKIKTIAGAAGALTLSTMAAQAGGIERSTFNPGFMFESGNYFEMTFGSVSPSVSGIGPTVVFGGPVASGDMAGSYTTASASLKQQVTDKLALGLIFDQPVGVNVAYPTGTNYFFNGANAEVTAEQLTLLGLYRLSENVSVYGGLRAQKAQGTVNDVRINVPPPGPPLFVAYDMQTQSDTAYGYVLGAAYERPEIALRIALSYVSEMTHDFQATDNLGPGNVDFSSTIPQSWNLDFQTGVAANTLVFGSIRWREWSQFNIIPRGVIELSSDNTDTVTYSLGVGRKFSDTFSGSLSVGHEAGAGLPVGNLGPTDGYTSVTLAGVYTSPNGIKVTVGASRGWLGDATTSGIGGVFADNSFTGAGVRIGYSF